MNSPDSQDAVGTDVHWTDEASKRLERAPLFLRGMVRRLAEKKARELDQAPFGIVGLETLLPITVFGLIEPGHLTWVDVIRMLTIAPAKLLGIPKGTLRVGADADVTIIDPEMHWKIDPAAFYSKSRNTPYGGWDVKGRAVMTIVCGEIRYELEASNAR